MWWIILAALGVSTAIYLVSIIWAWQKRSEAGRPSTGAGTLNDPSKNGRLSLRRIPDAILAFSRIVFFRFRIPLTSLTVMELFLTAAYISCLFAFEFSNSEQLISTTAYRLVVNLVISLNSREPHGSPVG